MMVLVLGGARQEDAGAEEHREEGSVDVDDALCPGEEGRAARVPLAPIVVVVVVVLEALVLVLLVSLLGKISLRDRRAEFRCGARLEVFSQQLHEILHENAKETRRGDDLKTAWVQGTKKPFQTVASISHFNSIMKGVFQIMPRSVQSVVIHFWARELGGMAVFW